MAKIKMDISEYEALKQVQQKLEDSLANERLLREQIEDMQEANIKALEAEKQNVIQAMADNEHTVTYITKSVSEQVVFVKRERTHDEILKTLQEAYWHLENNRFSAQDTQAVYDRIIRLFFDRVTHAAEDITSMERKGFDDVANEVRVAAEKRFNEENAKKLTSMSNKLKAAQKKADKYFEEHLEVGRLRTENLDFKARLEQYQKDLKEEQEICEIYRQASVDFCAIKPETGFGAGKRLWKNVCIVVANMRSKFDLREAAKNYKAAEPTEHR